MLSSIIGSNESGFYLISPKPYHFFALLSKNAIILFPCEIGS